MAEDSWMVFRPPLTFYPNVSLPPKERLEFISTEDFDAVLMYFERLL